ncbi:ABCC4, partial [Symbiodinium microadriaticum]
MSEMQTIGKALDLKAINYALYFCSPHVASFATFIVYINTGGTLTLPIIYTTLSLLQILRLVIGRMWTRAIETFSECTASCQRIENFLNTAARVAEEVRTRKMGYISEKSSGGMDGLPVTVTELSSQSCGTTSLEPEIANQRRTVLQLPEPCSFYYPKASTPTLSGIKFSVSLGEVVMVVGPVGSGKSSLLSSILGDLEAYLSGTDASGPVHTSSVVQFPRLQESTRIAYCAQRPWIIASSVRANVSLAGRKICNIGDGEAENFKRPTFIDSDLYNDAIEKCRLVDDLKLWPAADDTEIGERGVSVSGGQKVQHMQHADKILVLDKNGQQVFFGAYNELE